MNQEIHVKQLAPQTVVTARMHATAEELGRAMQKTLTSIGRAVHPSGAARGVPFAIYHNEPFQPEDVDVEMGVPIATSAVIDTGFGIERGELPGGAVAYAVHTGSYASIGETYAALFDWIEKHGHRRLGPAREIYLVGPGQGAAPDEYRTEIDVPID